MSMKKVLKREKLINAVVSSIEEDLKNGDKTVLWELLEKSPKFALIASLPETEWSKFGDKTDIDIEQKYMAENGLVCPHCESNELLGGNHDFDDNNIYQTVVCDGCGKKWTDVYTLTSTHIE